MKTDSLIFCAAFFLALSAVEAAAGAGVVIASKSYVDEIVQAIQIPQSDWEQADASAKDYIKNKPTLSSVAFSGNYNDLADKPDSGAATGHEYAVRSGSLQNAVENSQFYLDMDGLRFRAYKAASANRWGLRVANNTGRSVTYGSRGQHMYSGLQLTDRGGTLSVGAELNPDNETNDIGYSKEDVFVVYITNITDMHLYRWTVSVNVDKAIMVLERLY